MTAAGDAGVADPAEINCLRAENDALHEALLIANWAQRAAEDRAEAAERAVEPMLRSIDIGESGMSAEIAGPIVQHLAMAMACHFRASGAANYIEMGLNAKDPPFERYTVTVQRYGAKSAHMLRAEAEADRDRLAADFAAARAEVEAERRRYDEILKAADALRADAEAKDRRIAVLQGNLDRLEKLFWIELREPGKSPQRKGPFRCVDTAATLREFFAARPDAFMSVVSVGLDGPFFSDGPETLEMIDRRSRSVARRHRETTRAAFAARTAGGSDGRS